MSGSEHVESSLTVWGDAFSAQYRDGGCVLLHLYGPAREGEAEPAAEALLAPADVALLRLLLAAIELRRAAGTLPYPDPESVAASREVAP